MFLFAGLQLGYAGIDTRILRLFSVNTPKNPYLNQATTKQKKFLSNFAISPKIPESKSSSPKTSFEQPTGSPDDVYANSIYITDHQ